ncbi:hypothetical protein QW131_28185 [Roseibium salinum]|nr:hypothetical protein [Roseibium salinum]
MRKLFKKIGQDIMEMEEFKDDILAPFKGQGVADVDDVGIVVRGKFTTKPGKQFGVRKEIYKRVQREFEEKRHPVCPQGSQGAHSRRRQAGRKPARAGGPGGRRVRCVGDQTGRRIAGDVSPSPN